MNGDKVDDVDYNGRVVYCNDYNLDDSLIRYREAEIREVVTKQQFNSIKYVLGE